MNDPEGFTPREVRWLETPGGMARVLWYRYYSVLRLAWRAEDARINYEIMWGRPSQSGEPRGILNAGGYRLTR